MPAKFENITIPKNIHGKDDLDFQFLREQGISYIESLGSRLWTDYNLHDPGITILEVLCYAITDLGNRLSLPMEQILADQGKHSWQQQFHPAEDILPSMAITALDYRMLWIDIKGIRNCWLQPFTKTVYVDCKNLQMSYQKDIWEGLEKRYQKSFELRGLYEVLVDCDDSVSFEKIKRQIFQKYHQNRNLCEDLVEVKEIGGHAIKVCAVIEIDPTADEELIHARIELALNDYFSPPVRFYDLSSMVEKGYTTDQIFEGPLLQHGFLDPKEVENAGLREEVRLSDIIHLIMEIEGVRVIKDIKLGDCEDPEDKESWFIRVNKNKKPVLCNKSKFNFYKGLLPLNVDHEKVKAHKDELNEAALASIYTSRGISLAIPKPKPISLAVFQSIRNDFPENYGIGKTGLPETATPKRISQAKQLKGYLQFFDQVLGSYFKHLHEVKNLLSVHGESKRTYFTQAMRDIGDQDEYLGEWYLTSALDGLLMDNFDEPIKRKNQIADHLLARFAERFSDYVFVMKKLYGDTADANVLDSKNHFLREYATIGMERGTGFNYFRQPADQLWDTSNVSGLEKRVSLLAGFRSYLRRHLSRSYVEVYSFTGSKGATVYRWRIYDANRSILLSATESYNSPSKAYEEIYMVIQQVIVIEKELIEAHFEATEEAGYETADAGCFRITKSPKGRYSFSIINPSIQNPRDPRRIIASQYRYYSKANIKNAILFFKQFIKESFIEEGLFLVENILLRPSFEALEGIPQTFMPFCKDDCEHGAVLDPYSFRVTIVIPGTSFRFSDMVFRDYLENLIREELPAHVLAKICWVGSPTGSIPDQDNPLVKFEEAFKNFLLGLAKGNYQHHQEFIAALSELRSIYPSGSLYDCSQEDESGWQDKIILGRTNLGTI